MEANRQIVLEYDVIREFNVSDIRVNSYNVNKMNSETYDLLVQDMKEKGPGGIDPILLRKTDHGPEAYEAVDGAHRFKIANQLSWTTIRGILRELTELEARILNYRKNSERGSIDPLMEGRRFHEELATLSTDKPLEELSKRYGVSTGYISRRVSVTNLDKGFISLIEGGKLPISNAEPIVTLKHPDDKKSMLQQIKQGDNWRNPLTARDVETRVENLKQDRKQIIKLEQALEKAPKENRKCPKCKEKALAITHSGLPLVRCDNYHDWDIKTGKQRELYQSYSAPSTTQPGGPKVKKKKPEVSGTIRSKYSVQQWGELLDLAARRALTKFKNLSGISFSDGTDRFNLSVSRYGKQGTASLSYDRKGFPSLTLSMESHKYKSGELTAIKVGFSGNRITKKEVEDAEDFLKAVTDLKDKKTSGKEVEKARSEIRKLLKEVKESLDIGHRTRELKKVTEIESLINQLPHGKRA